MDGMPLIKKKRIKMRKNDLIFYIAFIAWPVLHFCVFYLGVNFNSLLLAFQNIDVSTNTTTWTLFGNLKEAWHRIFANTELILAAKISLLGYALPLLIGTPLALLFSYYIYKGMFGSKFFRVALFVPSIVSSIVMTVVFQYFVDGAMAGIAAKITGDPKTLGLLSNPDTRLGTILFYNLWVSFGVTTLMYVNAMYGIPPEQVEAARMDGAIGIREFWHVTLPSVFPTLATFLVTGVAGIFTNQLSIFNFYGSSAPPGIISYGYWLYKETLAGVYAPAQNPIIAAMGIWMTLVAVPITFLVRWLLDKFGPSAD